MLIDTYEERCLMRESKRRRLLRFLRDEIWSSVPILAQVLNLSVSATYKTLASFEREGLVLCHDDRDLNFKIWGITNAGLFEAWDDELTMDKRYPFEPSKFKPLQARHELYLQQARLNSESRNWSSWTQGKYLTNVDKRPDAIAVDPYGSTVYIELEATIKSRQRIEKIISIYLQKIKRQELSYVVYICPTPIFAKRLQKLFQSINEIPVAGRRVPLTDKHRSKFLVTSLDQWPNMDRTNTQNH